jgi:CheY-like chemotaxis protein
VQVFEKTEALCLAPPAADLVLLDGASLAAGGAACWEARQAQNALPALLLQPRETVFSHAAAAGAQAEMHTNPLILSRLREKIASLFAGDRSEAQSFPPEALSAAKLAQRYPLRILAAEDNPINQKLIRRVLEREGYALDLAGNGAEALEALRQRPYDLVLMDVHMPVMDGLEAARIICREMPPGQRPIVVAVTAGVMKDDIHACREAGMSDFVSKPFQIEELRGKLVQWGAYLQQRQAEAAQEKRD